MLCRFKYTGIPNLTRTLITRYKRKESEVLAMKARFTLTDNLGSRISPN